MEDIKSKVRGKSIFILFFLYVILQGALRKWMFPSLGTPLFLFQFVLLALVYINTPKTNELRPYKFTPAFQGLIIVYVFYGVLEVFNIRGTTNLMVQVYGFIQHFAFVPLIYYTARILKDDETLSSFLKGLAFVLLPLFFLGITQYFSSKGAFINRYAMDENAGAYEVAISGGKVRIAGTFSYLATYASFLCFILHLLFFGILVSLLRKKLNWYFGLAYGMGVINLLMTSSRGPTLYYAITEILTLGMLSLSGQTRFLKNLLPLSILLVGGYFILETTQAGSTALDNFFTRLTALNDLSGRIDDSQ